MSISHLVPVALLVLASMSTSAAMPPRPPAAGDAARLVIVSDCLAITVAVPIHSDRISICPPDLPPFPPM